MQIIRGFDSLPAIAHPVATVGSYDGVHLGHRVLIEQVVARAKRRAGQSVVITFEPHPRITLGQTEGLKILSTADEKALLLEQLGVDFMLIIPFDTAFSRLSHEQFIADYLIAKLGIEELVVGYNHHFGHNKSGDYGYLAEQSHIEVTQISQQLVDSQKVSSTVIRQAIESGDMSLATTLLGHTYIIIGSSDSRGAVAVDRYKLLPPCGVYSAVVDGKKSEVRVEQSEIFCNVKQSKTVIEL